MTIDCVVAAVDGSPSSLLAVDRAADEAYRRGIELRLVHASARERYEQGVGDDEDPASERGIVKEILFNAAERAQGRHPGLPMETEVLPDEPVPALLSLRRLSPLLLLGSRGRGGFHGLLLGSVSLRVAARAPYPVVVVHDTEQDRESERSRVVLGVGPRQTTEATDFAVAEAVLRQAVLQIVHAWPSHTDSSGALALMDTTAARVRALLDTWPPSGTQASRVQVERTSAPGTPASVLLHEANGADLVVVGAHRRRGHLGLQLGPVNHAVLHYAACPVAVVPCALAPDES